MAKKKSGKIIQMLSPENYIRKKVRTLPIHECLVNKEWKEQGAAHVIISRKHSNGNTTVCMYMIDLFCLGVKNTQYLFNISGAEYQEKKAELEEIELVPVSYNLAHNIVFAGLEYAAEYGFKPHKDFTSITQFMLEEDNDDIELIDIECGKNDKPFFVSGPYDDQAKINKILAQLERTAGPGNFNFLLEEDEPDDEYEDEFDGMSLEDQRSLFQTLSAKQKDLTFEEFEQLQNLTDHVIDRIVDPELIDQYSEEYLDDFDFEVTDDIFTEEMLGINNQKISEETRKLFTQIIDLAEDDPEQARKFLAKFKSDTPENPASYFLELILLKVEDNPEYDYKVKEYYALFPEYPLLKIEMVTNQFSEESFDVEIGINTFSMKTLFAGRTWIHHLEAYQYLLGLIFGLARDGDIDRIQGLYQAYNNLELTDDEFEILDELMFSVKSMFVEQILSAE